MKQATRRLGLMLALFLASCSQDAGMIRGSQSSTTNPQSGAGEADTAAQGQPASQGSTIPSSTAAATQPSMTAGGTTTADPANAGNSNNQPSANLNQKFLYAPYKDVTISANWNTYVISTAVTGSAKPLLSVLDASDAVVWSFATGECGSESWGGITADALVKANVSQWVAAKKNYIISTGGAAGSFKCSSSAGWLTFLQRYQSPSFAGVDFDIEASQTQADIQALVARIQEAQKIDAYKNLRFSFTIATLGGNSTQSLGPQGILVMDAIKQAGLTNVMINLMTMDYGSSTATNCVLDSSNVCQMGLSAIQAAENLHTHYSWPYDHLELTPMLGGNDSIGEVFTLEDVATVAQYVRQKNLVGFHLWSFDRDMDCSQTTASPICNSYGKAGTLGFSKAVMAAFK